MNQGRIEPELPALRKLAEDLAHRHQQKASTAHLLAALAFGQSITADLLGERRLGTEALLEDLRAPTSEPDHTLKKVLERAREIALRMGATHTGSAHVLLSLLSENRSAARQLIDRRGADAGRLRAAVMNVALGLVGKRRAQRREVLRAQRAEEPRPPVRKPEPPARGPSSAARGVTVPLHSLGSRAERARKKEAASAAQPTPIAAHSMPLDQQQAPQPVACGRRHKQTGVPKVDRFALDAQRFPTLAACGRNLTLAAARGELDPVVGRDHEIDRTLDVLAKRHGNNPCLVGAAGVGKTSVVRGLAQRIAEGVAGGTLDDRIVIELSPSELLAGTGMRGALATRFAALRKEMLAAEGRVVLFFDELPQLFAGDGADEIAADLKLALARGELPCIGATTLQEYARAIESDPALSRRFTLVEVDEPDREQAYLILSALAPKLEEHHQVEFSEAALAMSIAWSLRFMSGRALPDKAVSILDLCAARSRRRGIRSIEPEHVADVVAELTDVPVERMLGTDQERMLKLEDTLASRVVGHEPAMVRIARILRRNAAGLVQPRPIGTFLLLGPTGVGKTETAKAVAEALFHHEGAMTRLDMSEYSEPHAVARLIGSPPGYVGHESGGQLTEAVRRRPYQVVLLDEIEKAHPDVLTAFLGVFDEGRLTDGRGRTIDFTNTVIFMTSNLGASESGSVSQRRVGFGAERQIEGSQEESVVQAARRALPPELYNRIDEVIAFPPLSRSHAADIAQRLLRGVARALENQGIHLEVEPSTVEYLLDRGGYEPALGARPLKRAIARLVEGPLAEKILGGEVARGDTLLLGVTNGELSFDVLEADDCRALA